MAVPYTWKVATNKPVAFLRLLLRWKGTIYRYIFFDLCSFLLIYSTMSLAYRYVLSEYSRRTFEHFCLYCARNGHLIPVGLVLGFFVDAVVKRWWDQFQLIPWPDEVIMLLSAYVTDNSDLVKHKMKTVVRYANLAYIISLRNICSRVKKRYPVDQNLVADGLITLEELKRLTTSAPKGKSSFSSLPIFWAVYLILELRSTGVIISDLGAELIIKALADFRGKCAALSVYDSVNIPLAFTHVGTITIYTYVAASVFSLQFLDVKQKYSHRLVDLYIPIIGILQMIFYLGWLKVAEALINPFGEDADDFAVDKYIERNLKMSKFLVEELHGTAPPLSGGVILENAVSFKRRLSRDVENGDFLSRVSVAGGNVFMGSVNVEDKPRFRRLTLSQFE
ncbi:hypothetical protein Aperf_G00000013974 [Anoplocephala perfoliata]